MFYLGDMLAGEDADFIVPFQSIDSQTDHIELKSEYSFRLPSPRVSDSLPHPSGRLVNSIFRSVVTPKDADYQCEVSDVFNAFKRTYFEAVSDLMAKGAMPTVPKPDS